MVWVYSDPLTDDEIKVRSYIERTFKKQRYSEKIIKLLSLFTYLKAKKYSSAEELQKDIFVKKGVPLFDDETADKVYKALSKKRGGGEYPFTESLIKSMGGFLKNNDPIGISWIFEDGLWILTLPVRTIKSLVGDGIYNLISGSLHGLVETGVSGVNGIAADAAGPVGLAVVGIFTGIAAAAGAAIAVAEGDFSQAVLHGINFIPGVGPALVKGVNKVEHLAKTIDKNRDEINNIPLIGPAVTAAVEPDIVGGKRKTRRKKHRLY